MEIIERPDRARFVAVAELNAERLLERDHHFHNIQAIQAEILEQVCLGCETFRGDFEFFFKYFGDKGGDLWFVHGKSGV